MILIDTIGGNETIHYHSPILDSVMDFPFTRGQIWKKYEVSLLQI